MKLTFDTSRASGYKSASQIARVLTEAWFDEEMYCPACTSDGLDRLPDNTKVKDFYCPDCEETYQLKAKSVPFGRKVANSEYNTKIDKIRKGLSPNWSFLRYDMTDHRVVDLMIVPKHFMTLDAVEKRKPLTNKARRSGWVGSNILLDRLPPDAHLYVVKHGEIVPKRTVRREWERFKFLGTKDVYSRGWLNDVLMCVRDLGKEVFTLQELYEYEDKLKERYPNNKHVKAKIRQQMQELRDGGVVEFVDGQGTYRVK